MSREHDCAHGWLHHDPCPDCARESAASQDALRAAREKKPIELAAAEYAAQHNWEGWHTAATKGGEK